MIKFLETWSHFLKREHSELQENMAEYNNDETPMIFWNNNIAPLIRKNNNLRSKLVIATSKERVLLESEIDTNEETIKNLNEHYKELYNAREEKYLKIQQYIKEKFSGKELKLAKDNGWIE